MHRAEAGMPTEAPMIMRVAEEHMLISRNALGCQERTDITPDGRNVTNIARPDDRVHKLVQAAKRGPYHKVTCAGVHSLGVPWERNKSEHGAQTSYDREDRIGGMQARHAMAQRGEGETSSELAGIPNILALSRREQTKTCSGQWVFGRASGMASKLGRQRQCNCVDAGQDPDHTSVRRPLQHCH